MMARNLALICAAVLACGAAYAQSPTPSREKPSYDKALAAVTEAGCERSETDSYIRFFCEEGEALWYFTREGQPEHSSYFVAPAYLPRDRAPAAPITGGGVISADSREHADELAKARLAWMKDIYATWRRDAAAQRRRTH